MNCKILMSSYKRRLFFRKCIRKVKPGLEKRFKAKAHNQHYKAKMLNAEIQSFVKVSDINIMKEDAFVLDYVCDKYMQHRFDLLGSGWVSVNYGSKPLGVDGYSYQTKEILDDIVEAIGKIKWIDCRSIKEQAIIKQQISDDYKFINWYKDFKSGYCWMPDYISENDAINTPIGADIKTVWELSRFQHLPVMAMGAVADSSKRRELVNEFKNQILDFMLQNPYLVGCNWTSCMIVAIRAANLLIAYDMFYQMDREHALNEVFQKMFYTFIYDHGQYIIDNLEINFREDDSGNHYYSNITGLLFIAAYLNKRDWWLFARKEFFKETRKQFLKDGSCYEFSTSYHRLSSEMLIYGAALIQRIEGHLPEEILKIVAKAAYFTQEICKRNGKVVQIGDNDSGRFIKLLCRGEFVNLSDMTKKYESLCNYTKFYSDDIYFDENILDHSGLISASLGLIQCSEIFRLDGVEESFIRSLAGSDPRKLELKIINSQCKDRYTELKLNNTIKKITVFDIPGENGISGQWKEFDDFGLYYFIGEKFSVYVYRGRKYLGKGYGASLAHRHNDILHCEINIDGRDITSDSGTYVYSSNPKERDKYRSRKAHFVPDYGIEPNDFKGLFGMENKVKCECVYLNSRKLTLYCEYKHVKHFRSITILDNRIEIEDIGNSDFLIQLNSETGLSEGYGKKCVC